MKNIVISLFCYPKEKHTNSIFELERTKTYTVHLLGYVLKSYYFKNCKVHIVSMRISGPCKVKTFSKPVKAITFLCKLFLCT